MKNINGIITKSVGGIYTVLCGDGSLVECPARGIFRHEKITVCVGDIADVSITDDGSGAISALKERTSLLIRPPLANLEAIYITVAAAAPEPLMLTVDKMVSIAEFNKIEPIVIITKSELASEKAQEIKNIYALAGISVFVTSSCNGNGISEVLNYIKNVSKAKISAFAGVSGVGKSTLMNSLFPELHLVTGEISSRIERGKNTTRQVELFGIGVPGRFLADTPGFSLIDFIRYDFFSKEDLPYTFREFIPYLGSCRYKKCTHMKEDGCSVLEAVKNGEIAASRHESFVSLYGDLKDKHEWDKN